MPKYLRLVVAGGSCVGKTAVIEQAVFGKHSPGQVSVNIRNRLQIPITTMEYFENRASRLEKGKHIFKKYGPISRN